MAEQAVPTHFEVGDTVAYWSDTHQRWIPSVVQEVRSDGAVYDLNAKRGAQAHRLRRSSSEGVVVADADVLPLLAAGRDPSLTDDAASLGVDNEALVDPGALHVEASATDRQEQTWRCTDCTFENGAPQLYCEICEASRPLTTDVLDEDHIIENVLGGALVGGVALAAGLLAIGSAAVGFGLRAAGRDEAADVAQNVSRSAAQSASDVLSRAFENAGVGGIGTVDLPTHAITEEELGAGLTDAQCSICLTSFRVGEDMRTLPCFHYFHKCCVDQWLHRSTDCPVCRHSIV